MLESPLFGWVLKLIFVLITWLFAKTQLSLYNWNQERATLWMWVGIAAVLAIELGRLSLDLGGWILGIIEWGFLYVGAVGFHRRRLLQ